MRCLHRRRLVFPLRTYASLPGEQPGKSRTCNPHGVKRNRRRAPPTQNHELASGKDGGPAANRCKPASETVNAGRPNRLSTCPSDYPTERASKVPVVRDTRPTGAAHVNKRSCRNGWTAQSRASSCDNSSLGSLWAMWTRRTCSCFGGVKAVRPSWSTERTTSS